MKTKINDIGLLLLLCCNIIYASSVNASNNILEQKFKKSNQQNSQTYINSHSNRELNPSKQADADALASSVEFEFFKISEDSTSHTVFKSPSGICHGFESGAGVKVTDSATYYMVKNSQDEYYLNIAGAEISKGQLPKDMQYVPVFSISDTKTLKNIKEEDDKLGPLIAESNIRESSKVLSNIVCK